MKKEKTLYISDLDGTLLNSSAELSEYTTNKLNSMIANGLNFSVATARTAVSASAMLADIDFNVPLVLMNGVSIYDSTNKTYIETFPLSSETAESVVDAMKRLNVTGIMYQLEGDTQQTYYETLEHKPIRDFVEEWETKYNKTVQKIVNFSDLLSNSTIYFSLIDTYKSIQQIHESLSQITGINFSLFEDVYHPDSWYIEIHSDKASKRNGVNFLRTEYSFDRVIGFGDNINDLSMFKACDVRIAVANAKPEVKEAADYICGANENDGVAKWIEENIFSARQG